MIRTETVEINGRKFAHNYSDSGYMIEREGVRYADALDPAELGRTYTETDERIPYDGNEIEEKAAAYDILMGVTE